MSISDRVTLAQVAEAAGVSIATASRTLAGRGDLAPATRRRVLTAARELGYSRSPRAGGRPPAATRLFDLVLGSFHHAYADEVTAGARSAAARHGYDLVLTEERDTPDDDWPMRIRRRGSAGVALGIMVPTATQRAVLTEAGIPMIVVDPRAEATLPLSHVRTTDEIGGADAATHLAAMGATRFLVVGGNPPYRFGRARASGFIERLSDVRPNAYVDTVTASWGTASARDATLNIMRELHPGERLGVFACSDDMAAGVYAAAADADRSIPHDVLVVGFDDLRESRWLLPSLTTVRQPIREMAAIAVDHLAAAAAGNPLSENSITLPTRLIVRDSTNAHPVQSYSSQTELARRR
ncbi:LacI family transcriptional regulator [Microbacterium halimionae]|uniref:LacI family transcriptional regulator n=1 Tax=Microbacterium halimionae TaxID=1526413 RepID=A0A7W3JQX8_9MICO|nr:LacI family DNA-binding transcriptional regulator [Microbacterium halimionae]MBA8817263.1 LacI family transcriptional regulator [Microbacterium halimionae]NII94713.1 LacI family transcriptional regulator [Microbacterium halimionae]